VPHGPIRRPCGPTDAVHRSRPSPWAGPRDRSRSTTPRRVRELPRPEPRARTVRPAGACDRLRVGLLAVPRQGSPRRARGANPPVNGSHQSSKLGCSRLTERAVSSIALSPAASNNSGRWPSLAPAMRDSSSTLGRIERLICKRELFRGRLEHVDIGVARSRSGHERFRWVDGRHGRRTEPRDEPCHERPRSAADVERPLAVAHAGQIRHLRGQQDRVPAHESVVRLRGDIEAHGVSQCSRTRWWPRVAP